MSTYQSNQREPLTIDKLLEEWDRLDKYYMQLGEAAKDAGYDRGSFTGKSIGISICAAQLRASLAKHALAAPDPAPTIIQDGSTQRIVLSQAVPDFYKHFLTFRITFVGRDGAEHETPLPEHTGARIMPVQPAAAPAEDEKRLVSNLRISMSTVLAHAKSANTWIAPSCIEKWLEMLAAEKLPPAPAQQGNEGRSNA